MDDRYHYALAFRRSDGSSAGQVPVDVDWEPACESARFDAFKRRRREVPLFHVPRVDPVWHETMGEPYVGGVRVWVGGAEDEAEDETVTSSLTVSYFADLAQPAVQQLVDQDRALTGETLTYRVVAFPRAQQVQGERRFASEEVVVPPEWRPTSLTTFVRESLAIPDGDEAKEAAAEPEGFPVFLHPAVVREAKSLAERAGPIETGGILVGHLHQDPGSGRPFAEIAAQIPARGQGSSTSLSFTPQTWTDVRAALDLRCRGEQMLGWWHSHPVKEWCKSCPVERQAICTFRQGFLSAEDRLLHRTVFPRAPTAWRFSRATLPTSGSPSGLSGGNRVCFNPAASTCFTLLMHHA